MGKDEVVEMKQNAMPCTIETMFSETRGILEVLASIIDLCDNHQKERLSDPSCANTFAR